MSDVNRAQEELPHSRPEPWVIEVAPWDHKDPDGLSFKTGMVRFFHNLDTDQTPGYKEASRIELFQLAAERVMGASIEVSYNSRYLDDEYVSHNEMVVKSKLIKNKIPHLHAAVVVHGATPQQFEEALDNVCHTSFEKALRERTHAQPTVNSASTSLKSPRCTEGELATFDAYWSSFDSSQTMS